MTYFLAFARGLRTTLMALQAVAGILVISRGIYQWLKDRREK